MERRPRPRGESVLTPGMLLTAGLSITIGLLSMIALGQSHFHSVHAGQKRTPSAGPSSRCERTLSHLTGDV